MLDRRKYRDYDKGISIVEIIIVIAIMGIILAMTVPSYLKYTEIARDKVDRSSARNIATAAHMALTDGTEIVNIDSLVSGKYLDKAPKPQKKGKKEFVITVDGEKIKVKYDGESDNLLDEKNDSNGGN